MLVKCKAKNCNKKIDRDLAYKVEHVNKSGRKTNLYYCSKEEWEFDEKEKEYYRLCQYATDRILGETDGCKDNTRNKRLVELHKNYTYEEIYLCINNIEDSVGRCVALKWKEFENSYNKIAYIFGAINKEIDNYKGKTAQENNKNKEVDYIDEYKGSRNKVKNKPTLMDLIRKGNANGKQQ